MIHTKKILNMFIIYGNVIPFLKARKSNKRWKNDIIPVTYSIYGLDSRNRPYSIATEQNEII